MATLSASGFQVDGPNSSLPATRWAAVTPSDTRAHLGAVTGSASAFRSAYEIHQEQRHTMKRINTIAAIVLLALSGLAAAQVPRVQGTITTQNLVPAGAATEGSCVEIETTNKGVVGVGVSGTYTGALSGQATVDGATWSTLGPTPFAPATALGTPTATIASAATGSWQVSAIPGWLKFRVCPLAAFTGSAVVTLQSSPASIGSSGGGSGGPGDASLSEQQTQTTALGALNTSTDNIESATSRLTSSAGPNTAGSALSTTAFQIGGRYLSTPATMTNGQEAGVTLTTDQQLRARVTLASGAAASGSFASGAFASGAFASGSYASGAFASGSMVDLGAQADAAAAADNSTASLIALLKRTNQNLTTQTAAISAANSQLPPATGPQTPANSLATFNAAATGAATSVNDAATDATCLASNAARKGATVANDSSSTLYLLLANATSSATSYTVRMAQNDYYEVPYSYTGVIKCIWSSDSTGAARVTEITN